MAVRSSVGLLALLTSLAVSGCDLVFPTEKTMETYATGGLQVREVDWRRWKHWKFHVDLADSSGRDKVTVFSSKPVEHLQACADGDVVTI